MNKKISDVYYLVDEVVVAVTMIFLVINVELKTGIPNVGGPHSMNAV